ncbi:thiamine phosphate synthase [Candidatus Pelagibacter sp.]|nr:thiamine phosphate synthase [Candidatus Pelagibacter sp.]
MYKNFNETYHFIDKFKEADLNKLNNKISLIYRNYEKKIDIDLIKKIKKFCKKTNRKFYLANEIKLAFNLSLDGAYIPAFNKSLNHLSYSKKINFKLIGSAHSLKEMNIKRVQQVRIVFLSPVFMTAKNKKNLGLYRYMYLKKLTKQKTVALGGINNLNFKKIKLTKTYGIASISFIKNIYDRKSN